MASKRFTLRSLASISLLAGAMLAANVQTALAQRGGAPEQRNSAPRFWYTQYCASCHGQEGTGNGPVAPSLTTKPTDLTLLSENHGGVFPEREVREYIDGTKFVAAHGSREMPVWGYPTTLRKGEPLGFVSPELTPQEIQARIHLIVSYVKVIQKK